MRDVMDAVRNDAARSNVKRQSNRERMPHVAEIVDQIEAFFGKPKVLWCKEGDIEMGKRQ